MKTRDAESVITTYVDVENSSVELLLMEGFPWGAGTNVCFRCGDGVSLTAVNGHWERTLKELQLISLPSILNYEIVRYSDEEYDLPRNIGLEIDAVLVDAAGNETSVNVTDSVSIGKINADVSNGVVASWTYNNVTKTVIIPIEVTLVDLMEVTRDLIDFSCTYKTTEFTAEERITPINGTDYYFYDVKIYKEDLNPVATYHVEHSNGIQADLNLRVFEYENPSSSSNVIYIEEFENGNEFVVSTLRDCRLNNNDYGFGVLRSTGNLYLTGPQINGSSSYILCNSKGDFIGDVLAGRCILSSGGLWATNLFGTCRENYLNGYGYGKMLNFNDIENQENGSTYIKETDNGNVIYLRLDWRRREFCTLTFVDDVFHKRISTICVSNNDVDLSRLSIWMPFSLRDIPQYGNCGYFIKLSYKSDYFNGPTEEFGPTTTCPGSDWQHGWYENMAYHISPFVRHISSGDWELENQASFILRYTNYYFGDSDVSARMLQFNVTYTRANGNYSQYSNFNRSSQYDFLGRCYAEIRGAELWGVFKYITNYFTTNNNISVVDNMSEFKIQVPYRNLFGSIAGTRCVPVRISHSNLINVLRKSHFMIQYQPNSLSCSLSGENISYTDAGGVLLDNPNSQPENYGAEEIYPICN